MNTASNSERRVELELHTPDRDLLPSLFGSMPEPGSKVVLGPNVVLEYIGSDSRAGAFPGLPEILHVIVDIGTGVLSKVAADWIYGRIKGKGRVVQMRVNRRATELTPEGLERSIEESINSDD